MSSPRGSYVVLALFAFLGVTPGRCLDAGDTDDPLFLAFLVGLLRGRLCCCSCFVVDEGAREASEALVWPAF